MFNVIICSCRSSGSLTNAPCMPNAGVVDQHVNGQPFVKQLRMQQVGTSLGRQIDATQCAVVRYVATSSARSVSSVLACRAASTRL